MTNKSIHKVYKLSIDIETRSGQDIGKCGVYRYAEDPDFAVLLFGYRLDDGPVRVVDLAGGEALPDEIRDMLADDRVEKWAFNAAFERVCLSRYLGMPTGEYLKPDAWRCSMVWCATLGLPLSLAEAGSVLGLERQKLKEGRELIRLFCTPAKGAEAGKNKWTGPADAPEKWERFKAYNLRDVEAEQEIQKRLQAYPVPDFLWKEYAMDQRINDRGVAIDGRLVQEAIRIDEAERETLLRQMQERTGLANPNSVAQLKGWLAEHGVETESLGRKTVAEIAKHASPEVREVLELRQKLAKSSVKKYQAMKNVVCSDGRARGCFQFYGAGRTGRWSGRLIQLQNLPQNHLEDLSAIRTLVREGSDRLKERCPDLPGTLSQLIRTAFVPRAGTDFLVADFSAIEARVIAWYAGETWRQEVFANGGDIYCASASAMFHVPVEKHGINGHLRQKGKIAELALGYGGGAGALKAMGALEMGVPEEELKPLVKAWREANPKITAFWEDVDKAARQAVRRKGSAETHGLQFIFENKMLFVTLPSGRRLAYVNPQTGFDDYLRECILYEGVGPTHKWETLHTYGPKLVENIVQATARDLLSHAMQQLSDRRIVMHIHDEVVIEAPAELTTEEVCARMANTPEWAEGLLLRADGYRTEYYRKD